jgi:RNA polymerase sigma-70 factor, ECF subfamily
VQPETPAGPPVDEAVLRPSFEEVYVQTSRFVLNKARRLGVEDSLLDDVMQEVFVAVYRRLNDFEGRSSVKTWVSGILVKLVQNYRRTQRRKGGAHAVSSTVVDPDEIADPRADPNAFAKRTHARQALRKLLEDLTEEKALVFVMVELEGMTVPEVAQLMGANVNTIASRLRVARSDFNLALARMFDKEEEVSEDSGELSQQAQSLLRTACSLDEPTAEDARRICESVLTSIAAQAQASEEST